MIEYDEFCEAHAPPPVTKITALTVAFRNHNLTLIDHGGEPYVAMRPIVEDWKSQHAKISNDSRFKSKLITIPHQTGRPQTTLCIPLRTSLEARHV